MRRTRWVTTIWASGIGGLLAVLDLADFDGISMMPMATLDTILRQRELDFLVGIGQ